MTRLSRNIVYNVAGQGAVLIISLVAVRFIFGRLGADVFGIIFFNQVVTLLLANLLDLGLSSTIVREVSSHFDVEREYVRDLIRTATAVYWAIGLVLVGVIWVAAPLLVTHWLNLRTMDAGTATTMLRILSALALVALPKSLYTSLFRGRQMMGLNNSIDVGTAIIQQAGILLLLLGGGHAFAVAAWISISALLGILVYTMLAARLFGWTDLVPRFSMHAARRNVGFTGHMMVISILSFIHYQAAQVIVSKLMTLAQFGYYGFISSTVNRATFVTGAIAQAAYPSFSNLSGQESRGDLLIQYRKLHDLVSFGTLPLFAGICFAAVPVYSYVFSSGSIAAGLLLPTAFLALGSWMNATVVIPYMLSLAMGKPQIAARLNVYALILVLPVTLLLILAFGLPGAGFSWVFYHLFAYAYMVPRISRECLGTPARDWYWHIARVYGLALITYGVAWLVISTLGPGPDSLVADLIGYVVGSGLFCLGAYLMIGPDLRQTIQRLPVSLAIRKAGAH